MKPYGLELLMDLSGCNVDRFNRTDITKYFVELCDLIDMQREDLHFWDYEGVPEGERTTEPHLLGTSAVQFISTSNIIIHTLDLLGILFVDVFSCKSFDQGIVEKYTIQFFGGKIDKATLITRGDLLLQKHE